MQLVLLPDNTIMIGTTMFSFVDRRTAAAALLEAGHAFWKAGPQEAFTVLTTIAGNQHGAKVSGKQ